MLDLIESIKMMECLLSDEYPGIKTLGDYGDDVAIKLFSELHRLQLENLNLKSDLARTREEYWEIRHDYEDIVEAINAICEDVMIKKNKE